MTQIGFMYNAKDATEAFDHTFSTLVDLIDGETADSRDGDVVAEILNACITIEDPTRGIVQSDIRRMPMRYAVGELLWYLSGSNRTKDIATYSKKWEELSDDGIHAESAYGYRIFTAFGFDQWNFIKGVLERDPNSRQAIIHIKHADDQPTKDMPCTLALQFFIRNNALHLTTNMRSNDIWYGFPYDVFSFTAMQVKMAFELCVNIGSYTHLAGSLHLYKRDYDNYYNKLK